MQIHGISNIAIHEWHIISYHDVFNFHLGQKRTSSNPSHENSVTGTQSLHFPLAIMSSHVLRRGLEVGCGQKQTSAVGDALNIHQLIRKILSTRKNCTTQPRRNLQPNGWIFWMIGNFHGCQGQFPWVGKFTCFEPPTSRNHMTIKSENIGVYQETYLKATTTLGYRNIQQLQIEKDRPTDPKERSPPVSHQPRCIAWTLPMP